MSGGRARPVILALSSDLFIAPRLQDVSQQLGFELVTVDSAEALGAEGSPLPRSVPLTEPLEGPDAAFVRKVVELQPALLLVDLDSQDLPWERWIHILKTSAATRRIPILAFGPHVEQGALAQATRAGADQALPRGQALGSLARLIRDSARVVDEEGLRQGCQGELSPLGRQGVALLNAGDYFEAHEALEHAWMEATELEGYLYRALLQVAVAYLHVERDNYRGAVKMLLRLRQWLEPLPDECRGVDLAGLRAQIGEFRHALEAAGPRGLALLDRSLLRPIPLLGG
jgi:uncharacterized protein